MISINSGTRIVRSVDIEGIFFEHREERQEWVQSQRKNRARIIIFAGEFEEMIVIPWLQFCFLFLGLEGRPEALIRWESIDIIEKWVNKGNPSLFPFELRLESLSCLHDKTEWA